MYTISKPFSYFNKIYNIANFYSGGTKAILHSPIGLGLEYPLVHGAHEYFSPTEE